VIDWVGMGVPELDADGRDGVGECEKEGNVKFSGARVMVLAGGTSFGSFCCFGLL